MKTFSVSHLADHALIRSLDTIVSEHRGTTASLLAHLAEVDERKLYLPAGHPSMYHYCMGRLHMSEDVAFKRIRAARAARHYPAIYPAVAEGRLHLSAVVLLAPYLTPKSAEDLLAAATHKSKAEIELLLAQRFPKPDVPALVQAITPPAADGQEAPAHVLAGRGQVAPTPVASPVAPNVAMHMASLAPGPVMPSIALHTPGPMEPLMPRTKIAPLSPERYALQATLDQETHDLLRRAQALLGHSVPSGDVVQVLNRVLRDWVQAQERRRFGLTDKPRSRRSAAKGRYIPAEVRRAVRQRDGDQCTFVSDNGHRCQERRFLELDHIDPFARGGRTTAANLRLRCRAHNQHEAERTYGAGFVRGKREGAREKAARSESRRAAMLEAACCPATSASSGLRAGTPRCAARHPSSP
jgi:hypothetical protein